MTGAGGTLSVSVGTPFTATDGYANPTVAGMSEFNFGYNGSTWDRIRTGLSTAQSATTGIQNTIPMGKYNAAAPTLTDTYMSPLQLDVNGNIKITAGTTITLADALANSSYGGKVNFGMIFNGTTWDRARSGQTGTFQSFTGMQNVMTVSRYNATEPTVTDGYGVLFQCNTKGSLKTVETGVETIVVDLSGTSPSSNTTVAGQDSITAGYADLSNCRNFTIVRTLQGATGGTLDVYLQFSPDGSTWYDWAHFDQQAGSAAANTKVWVPALTNTSTTIGSGTSPALAVSTFIGGHPTKAVRVLYVSGSGTSVGAAQTIKLIATRPKA